MGFFSSIGEALFGTETKKKATQAQADAAKAQTAATQQAMQQSSYAQQQAKAQEGKLSAADLAVQQSMGANAADYMKRQQQAASGLAEQGAQTAATQGTRAALKAARTAGLNPAQAALTSGQQAGDIYTGSYQQGLEKGMDRYASGTGQFQQQASSLANRQQGQQGLGISGTGVASSGASALGSMGSQMAQQAQQTAQGTWSGIGSLAGAAAGLLSDKNAKTDIKSVISKLKLSDENVKEEVDNIDAAKKGASTTADKMKTFTDTAKSSDSGFVQNFGKGMEAGRSLKEGLAAKANAKEVLSDEQSKQNINKEANIDQVLSKIRPVTYKYKEGAPTPDAGQDKMGVIAQDLEKTALKDAVKMGDDGLKRIDTAELSPMLLNLIAQQHQRIIDLEKKVGK